MFVSCLRVPKRGSSLRECEDAAHVLPAVAPDTWLAEPVFAAVSDGASESLLAGEWADLLARSVVGAARDDWHVLQDGERFAAAVAGAGEAWRRWADQYVEDRMSKGRPIMWYEQPKMERGPYATLLAARFDGTSPGPATWDVAALGDSCFFQTRDERLLHAFPIASSEEFGNSPDLINGLNRDQALLTRHVRTMSGRAEQGDQFFLCTDALAAWFLDQSERGGRPWETLCNFTRSGDVDAFTQWLDETRAAGSMNNDDVAVVHVDLG